MSRDTYEADKVLVTAAARKVVNAEHRGTLPHGMSLRVEALRIELGGSWDEGSDVLTWLRTNYPGGTEERPKYVDVHRGRWTRSVTRTESVRVSVPLRERVETDGNGWLLPELAYTVRRCPPVLHLHLPPKGHPMIWLTSRLLLVFGLLNLIAVTTSEGEPGHPALVTGLVLIALGVVIDILDRKAAKR